MKYGISPFEHLLSNNRLVSKERRVKKGHFDRFLPFKWRVSFERLLSNEHRGISVVEIWVLGSSFWEIRYYIISSEEVYTYVALRWNSYKRCLMGHYSSSMETEKYI